MNNASQILKNTKTDSVRWTLLDISDKLFQNFSFLMKLLVLNQPFQVANVMP